MLCLSRSLENLIFKRNEKLLIATLSSSAEGQHDQFRALNIKNTREQAQVRRQIRKAPVLPPRTNKMAIDQDWGSVWPGPRSFHPATVPLPVRQGFTEKGASPPDKHANAELMKIPNFLHLTPPVIKRQCEALKKFCTPWPKELNTDTKIEQLFPLVLTTSDYCHSSPTIRDPMARIVTLQFKLSSLKLDSRAIDKFLRLAGDRYSKENDTVTIVTDRCPLKKQNTDYAMYLLTALYHESKKIEPWEELKSEADMEYYDWEKNESKKNVEVLFGVKSKEIPHIKEYSEAVTIYMNEGENDYTLTKYGEAVRQILNLQRFNIE